MTKQKTVWLVLAVILMMVPLHNVMGQWTYHYPGGKITQRDLMNSWGYKKGTRVLTGSKRNIIVYPKYDRRGNRYLAQMMEHFLSGGKNLDDSAIQIESLMGGTHGVSSVLSLLMDTDARKMLQLSGEQGEKINDLFVDYRQQLGERMNDWSRQHPGASKVEHALARMGEMEQLTLWLRTRLLTILSEGQLQQVKEMVFQLTGGLNTVAVDLELLSLFKIDKKQRDKLATLAEEVNTERVKIYEGPRPGLGSQWDRTPLETRLEIFSQQVGEKIAAELNDDQKMYADALMKEAPAVQKKLGLAEEK